MTSSSSTTAATAEATPTVAVSNGDDDATPKAGPQQGDVVGRYVVLETLGRGGMGSVFRAYDPKLQREVAIKQLHREDLLDDGQARLVTEARAMAQLSHPNVVSVYDVDIVDGSVTLAMELVPGQTLRQWLRERPAAKAIVGMMRQAGEGLAAAHDAGLVHRDFKPSNVLVDATAAGPPRVKVTDFGIAKGADDPLTGDHPSRASRESFDESLDGLSAPVTRGDIVLGTPRYMAPEQHQGHPADPRADQYAFCVTLWEALAGEAPFTRGERLLERKLAGPPAWPVDTPVPRPIAVAIERGLAPSPDRRWPTMRALLDALGHDPSQVRRRRWFASAAVVVSASAVLAARTEATEPTLCTGLADHLDGVWDSDQRAALTERLHSSKATYAETTATRVGDALDTYAEQWVQTSRDACEAHNVRGEQSASVMDLRMACLQRARTALSAAVEVLDDESVVKDAHRVVGGLPRLARCSDVAALAADVPPPEDAAVAAEVERSRAQLARIQALIHAGKYRQSVEVATELQTEVEEIDYLPLHAEAKAMLGKSYMLTAKHEPAREQLEAAAAMALEAGDLRRATMATTALTHLLGARLARFDEAERLGNLAIGLARRPSADPMETARALATMGAVANGMGELARGESLLREALEIKEGLLGPDHIELADTLYNLAGTVSRRGRNEDARPLVERALALNVRELGPDHPKVASTVAGLGIIALESGDYDEADRRFERAVTIYERTHGTDHPSVANQLQNWAIVHVQTGRFEQAEALHRRALDIMTERLGPEHPSVAAVLSNLAVALEEQGKRSEALTTQRRALAIREANGDGLAADSLGIIGRLLHADGKLSDALDHLTRAVALYEKTLDADNPRQAWAMATLGDVQRDLGRKDEALSTYRRAIEIVGDRQQEPELFGSLLFATARLTWDHAGDAEQARALAERALGLFTDVGEPSADSRAEVDAWLAAHPRG